MKKPSWIIIGIVALVLLFVIILRIGNGGEDTWIKDSKGVWVKHGVPSDTPDYVLEQQKAVLNALEIYNSKKDEGMVFSSQCLGSTGNYAVDIVHVPRSEEDNLVENQCEDFRNKKVDNFIELDKDGNIVRVVD